MTRFGRFLRRDDAATADGEPQGAQPAVSAAGEAPVSGGAEAAVPAASPDAGAPAAEPAAHTARVVQVDGAQAPAGAAREAASGVDEEALDHRPVTRRRSRLRRRSRYLTRARELVLRDLGGLVYELHRTGPGAAPSHPLVDAKVARLRRVDDELRELSDALGATREVLVVRAPGVGGTCPSCGELHASDARYCSACGTRLDGRHAAEAPEEQLAVSNARERLLQATGGASAPDAAATSGEPAAQPTSGAANEPVTEARPAAAAAGAEPSAGAEAVPSAGAPADAPRVAAGDAAAAEPDPSAGVEPVPSAGAPADAPRPAAPDDGKDGEPAAASAVATASGGDAGSGGRPAARRAEEARG